MIHENNLMGVIVASFSNLIAVCIAKICQKNV